MKTVRYRVIHGGAGRYKAAKGTTRWTAIEFQAVGNNGGPTDRRHTVVR